jgi:hypothetical protein
LEVLRVEEPIDREALLDFLGYGNPRAEAVFLGMEEGLTIPPPLADQLARRSAFAPIVDLHRSPGGDPQKFLAADDSPIQPTWNTIIRVLLALEGRLTPTIDEMREYQRHRLARSHERAALLSLLPLPAQTSGAWPYGTIFAAFPTRKSYLDGLLEARIGRLAEHLAYGPPLVIAYGSNCWPSYKKVFPGAGAWRSVGPFEVADTGGTKVILAPHFRAQQMNGQRGALIDLARDFARA